MNNLEKLRKDIDKCDKELAAIFSKRFSLVKKVALYKKKNNLKPLDLARWQEVLKKVLTLSKKKGVSSEFMESVMDLIHKESLQLEKDVISPKKIEDEK